MNYQKINDKYILKLETHEEFIRELKKFCIEHNIKNASVSAIGSVNSVTLGFYNTATKEYQEKSFHTSLELTSALGTVTCLNGDEYNIHIHVTVSDRDFRAYGGHLFRAIVSKTIEILIVEL